MNQPAPAIRYYLAGVVLVALITAAVILVLAGRGLTELLALVGLVVLPVLGALGYNIKEQTNGNTSELLTLVRTSTERAQDQADRAEAARQADKAELLGMVSDLSARLHAAPPPAQ